MTLLCHLSVTSDRNLITSFNVQREFHTSPPLCFFVAGEVDPPTQASPTRKLLVAAALVIA
jgi:hypothetical protein